MEDDRQKQKRDSTSLSLAASPAFVHLGEGDFHARLGAAPGVAVVLFSAPHCGACRAWKRLLPQALLGIADALFEVDVSEATGVARYYDIFHLPAIYLYREGRFHAEVQCAATVDAIRDAARGLLLAAAHEEP